MDSLIAVQQQGRVRRIVLNRPEKLNALTPAMEDQLVAEILRADPDTRAQTKGLLHAGAVGEYADQLEREAESISAALAKPAAQSRIRAFVDRSEQRRSGKEK